MTETAVAGDERSVLLTMLQRQRDLVAWKLHDADDEAMRAVVTSTGLSAHGLVRHLENVERSWFRDDFAGQAGLTFDWTDDDGDAEFKVPSEVSLADLLDAYRAETARCDEVIAAHSLDDLSADGRAYNLRWIVVHLIEETARHLGHLDLLREQADGVTGEEPRA